MLINVLILSYLSNFIAMSSKPVREHLKKGNHSKTQDTYISDRTKREHRARQSLFTPMEKANLWSENTGLPYFQLFLDKDGDLIIYSNNGDKETLFPKMQPLEIMSLTLQQIYDKMKVAIQR